MKNSILTIIAAAGLLSLASCAKKTEEAPAADEAAPAAEAAAEESTGE